MEKKEKKSRIITEPSQEKLSCSPSENKSCNKRKKSVTKGNAGQQEFRKLSDEFHALLDAIPDDLFLLSPELKILWSNNAFASKFRKSPLELSGRICYRLCCDISSPCKNCPVIRSFQSGKKEATRVLNREGKILDIRALPVKDESGNVENVIEHARDITAKVHMEEEAKLVQSRLIHANKMTSLGTLVSGVAHEINNPNSFILSNVQTLDKIWQDAVRTLEKKYQEDRNFRLAGMSFTKVKEVMPELLNGINAGSVRIKNIVNNLKDFSRPEKASLNEKVNINTVILTSRSILDNHIRKHTNNFHINCADNLPLVRGSSQQIEQVVINIMMNALQSLPDKLSAVRVTTSYDKKSDCVLIEIKDEGCGMSDDLLKRVTEPFFTTRIDSGGTGLGLSISYTIVKEHNGELQFRSKEGSGTTVSVRLPAYNG